MKAVWRSATTEHGALSVTMVSPMLLLVLFVANLVSGKTTLYGVLTRHRYRYMGVGAGSRGRLPPPRFGQNAEKFGQQKIEKKISNLRQRKQNKIVQRVYSVLHPRVQVSLNRGSRLGLLNSTFNNEN